MYNALESSITDGDKRKRFSDKNKIIKLHRFLCNAESCERNSFKIIFKYAPYTEELLSPEFTLCIKPNGLAC